MLNADLPPTVSPLPAETQRIVVQLLHPLCLKVYTVSVERALSRPNVAMVARALSWSSRQLERRFVNEGLPPPHRLVALSRWIPVSRILADEAATTSSVARVLGFASTQAFCRATHRELGMSVSELRSCDASLRIAHDLVTAYQVPIIVIERRDLATACRISDTAVANCD